MLRFFGRDFEKTFNTKIVELFDTFDLTVNSKYLDKNWVSYDDFRGTAQTVFSENYAIGVFLKFIVAGFVGDRRVIVAASKYA